MVSRPWKDDRKDDRRGQKEEIPSQHDFVTFWDVGDLLYSQYWLRGEEPDQTKWTKIGGVNYHGRRDGGWSGLYH